MRNFGCRTLAGLLLIITGVATAEENHSAALVSPVGSKAPVMIEIATIGASEAGEYLVSEIEMFKKAHPEIAVTYYAVAMPRRENTPLHEMTHIGQNIVGLASVAGTEPYFLVSRDLLVPIDKFLPDPEFPDDLFYENLWDAVTYKGQRWGIPFLCNSYALVCDWYAFQVAGIAEPPTTWQEFFNYAKRFNGLPGANESTVYVGGNIGFASRFEQPLSFIWKTMVLQQGGHFVKDGRFELSHPSLRESYVFIRELLVSGYVELDDRELKHALRDPDKQYAMRIQPVNRIRDLTHFETKTYMGGPTYRIAPLPTFDQEVSLDEKRYYLSIRKSTPEKEAASWKFLKWLCRPDSPANRRHPGHFTFPSTRNVLERADVASQFASFPENSEFVHLGKAWPLQWHNLEADTPAAKERFNEIVEDMFGEKLTFEAAMEQAESECNAILRSGSGEVQPYALYR